MPSTKRPLTEQAYRSITELNCRNDGLAPELSARLRNVGSHVRKHVNEGYATNRHIYSVPPAPHSSPAKATTSETPIFCSAIDTIRDVYSTWPSGTSPATPSLKRTRSEMDIDPAFDGDPHMDCDEDQATSDASRRERPVKPLRRSKRQLLETRSLPAGALWFSNEAPCQRDDMLASSHMDEDWSLALSKHSPAQDTKL